MKIIIFYLFIILKLCSADVPVVRPELLNPKDQKYTAGDRIELEIRPSENGTYLPQLPTEIEKGPVEWGTGRILEVKQNTNNVIHIVLTCYTPGDFKIDSISFYEKLNPKEIKFKTEPLSIHFETVEGEKEKDELFEPNLVKYPMWAVISISVFALILLVLILYLINKYLNKNKKISTTENLNPFENFERKRKFIEKQNYLATKNFKKHYFSISETVKQFLSSAYDMDLEDKTSSEMFDVLTEYSRGGIISSAMVEQFRKCFEEMDIVKYTDQNPGQESETLILRVSTLIAAAWKLSPMCEEIERKKKGLSK